MTLSIIRIICISMTRMLIVGVRFKNKNLLVSSSKSVPKDFGLCDYFIRPKCELAIPDCIIHGKQRCLKDTCYQTSWTNSANSNRKKLGVKKIFSHLYSSIEIPPYQDPQREIAAFRAKQNLSTKPPACWKWKKLEKISHAGESPVFQHRSSNCRLFWS